MQEKWLKVKFFMKSFRIFCLCNVRVDELDYYVCVVEYVNVSMCVEF